MVDSRIVSSFIFIILSISTLSTTIDAVPPTITLICLVSIPFCAYVWLPKSKTSTILIFTIISFISVSLLSTLHGVLYGWDSWLYVGSAELVQSEGWTARGSTNINAHQFPGIQLTSVALSAVAGIEVLTVANYLPMFLKSSMIVFVYLIGRITAGKQRIALFAPILLVVFTPFITWLPYHHITYGFALKFAILHSVLTMISQGPNPPQTRRRFLVLAILMAGLLISHQLSMFQVMLMIGITVSVYTGVEWISNKEIRRPQLLVTIWSLFLVFSLLYYLWVSTEYFVRIVQLQSAFGTGVPPEPDPLIEQKLERLYTGGTNVVSIGYWMSNRGVMNLIAFLTFGISGVAVLYELSRNLIVKWAPNKIEPVSLTVFAYVGMFGAFRALSTIGVGRLGGTRRLLLSSLPFAVAGMLKMKESNSWDGSTFKTSMAVVIAIGLVLSVMIFPGYLLTADATLQENSRQESRIFMSHEEKSTYEWSRYGSHVQTDSKGMLYINGRRLDTKTHVEPRVYAGDYTVIPEGSLFITAQTYKKRLPLSGYPFEYKIPETTYNGYSETSKLERVYDSGKSEIYRTTGQNVSE